jgi:hypothetical protein
VSRERRTNNLRVLAPVLNDGRTQISVTVAKLLVQEIEDLREELATVKADTWVECSAAHTRWGEALWEWEHGYIDEKPGKPRNPYHEEG